MTCISRPPFIASHYSLQCLTQKPSCSACLNSFTSIHLIFLLPNPPPNKATVPMNRPGIWTQNKKFVHILLFYLQFQSQFPMFGSTRGMVQWQLDSMQYSIRILMYYSIQLVKWWALQYDSFFILNEKEHIKKRDNSTCCLLCQQVVCCYGIAYVCGPHSLQVWVHPAGSSTQTGKRP